MKKSNELSYKDLKMICNPDLFQFETTDELEPINTGIGQDRGIKALEFGINVDIKGYNLYLEGPSGVGKTMYTKNYLEKICKKKKTPNDWCYIYNFDDPNEPVAVSLAAGQGKEFKETMDSFIKDIQVDIKNTFNNDDFEKEKALIKNEYEMGHVIGVHTYSHNYKKIYSSFENYIDDVNKMNEIIKKYTGNFSNILRFPGGSSNTISRKYKKGIMTELTREVSNLGYTYFDWNVASGDVNGYGKNRIYKRIIKSLNDKPTIILMHDTKYNT